MFPKQGMDVAKLVDNLKKSMEGHLNMIDACLYAPQKEHQETKNHLDETDQALSADDNHIKALEVMCQGFQEANFAHRAALNNLEGHSMALHQDCDC